MATPVLQRSFFAFHVTLGDLLIYAAGTWFVMVHGPAWPSVTRRSDAAAVR